MDNLNDKISNEAQNQPSCLGAVSRCSVTQEQIDNRTSDYVCWDCGRQFLTDEQKKRESVVTAHKSICGLCNEEKYVTSIRHWNWLRLNIG